MSRRLTWMTQMLEAKPTRLLCFSNLRNLRDLRLRFCFASLCLCVSVANLSWLRAMDVKLM